MPKNSVVNPGPVLVNPTAWLNLISVAWTRNFLAADWIPALSVGDNGMRSTRLREDYRRNLQEPQMQTMFLCAGSASIHGLAELFLHSHDQPRGREHVRWATQRQQSTGVGNTGDTLTQLPSVSRRPQRMPLLEGECKADKPLEEGSLLWPPKTDQGFVAHRDLPLGAELIQPKEHHQKSNFPQR
ncbi:hypothetical protein I7I51_07587 [Histoplasma capsulatum]|uniref:Uncharacterized protein n=1 Tax=Ajellomyces capsulatus TaxID=5037 RepID=A0A8A1M0G6_AJECA|nr:hypothetical protein I7I51_07587 [Histoplasma capsulatum]